MPEFRIKRVYDAPAPEDGFRVLVDRIWPRGISKDAAAVELWAKEIAPSTELRRWFGHDPARWGEFRRRYLAELDGQHERLEAMRKQAGGRRLTLVYSARDQIQNQAVVLRDVLEGL